MHPVARETLLAAIDTGWADERRLYAEARTARRLLDQAREVLADGLGVRPPELSFVPSGWGLHTAMRGLRHARRRIGDRVVASAVEQEAILAEGAQTVPVDRLGRVDLPAWTRAMAEPGVVAAALQDANGEVGTTQPLGRARAAAIAREVPLLVDASASLGRSPTPVTFDVLVGEAASFAGPALGLLAVPEGVRWALPGPRREPEFGRAEAAPWVPLALATAEAWRQAAATRDADSTTCRKAVDRLRTAAAAIPDVDVVGDAFDRLPHILTFSVLYVDGEMLVRALDARGLGLASGSACTASLVEPSHVLAAMGALTHGNVRLSLPLPSVVPGVDEAVDRLARELPAVVAELRADAGAVGL